ncbi:hypothetical protein GCM10023339_40350 [Alloalcanivorax gelatiniphagus]
MPSESDLLEALHAAYNAGDADKAASLYADDGVHLDVAAGKPKTGRAAITSGLKHFFAAFPDAHWSADVSATGDGCVFARYVLTGTLQQDMWSLQAQGQQLNLPGIQVLECVDGHIVRSEDYWDAGMFQRQMSTTNAGDSK